MRKLKENNKKTHLSFKNNNNNIHKELKLFKIRSENNFKWICSTRNIQNYAIKKK